MAPAPLTDDHHDPDGDDDSPRWRNGDKATNIQCRLGIIPNSSLRSPLAFPVSVRDSSSPSQPDSLASSPNRLASLSKASSSSHRTFLASSSPSRPDFQGSSSLSRLDSSAVGSSSAPLRPSLLFHPFLPFLHNSNNRNRMCRAADSSAHNSQVVF